MNFVKGYGNISRTVVDFADIYLEMFYLYFWRCGPQHGEASIVLSTEVSSSFFGGYELSDGSSPEPRTGDIENEGNLETSSFSGSFVVG